MGAYGRFLASKKMVVPDDGVTATLRGSALYDFQADITEWALRKGRAAVFADCGLGKTPMQLLWAREVCEHTHKPVLVVAPLAVSTQTQREGEKFDVPVHVCRDHTDMRDNGVHITNYEMLQHFEPDNLGGLVLDESSILKSYSGKFRKYVTDFASKLHFRLACTATPAPNDLIEIINHAEFLGTLTAQEILGRFFVQDCKAGGQTRLKHHGQRDFWCWMCSWAWAVRKPSDMGYDDGRFVLPDLHTYEHTVDGHLRQDYLFPVVANTMQERLEARRESVEERADMAAAMVNASTEPWLCWCKLNAESAALTKAIPDAIEVKGSDTNQQKSERMLGFADGKYRVLVTKPRIAGFGMNWQHCPNMAFVGLGDSFEEYYQATRRCWRFGQTKDVHRHLIIADTEGAVLANVQRKENEAARMMANIIEWRRQVT